jgi:hypothetical protein
VRDAQPAQQSPDRADAGRLPARGQFLAQFAQRDMRPLGEQLANEFRFRGQPTGAAVAALRLGRSPAGDAVFGMPADRGGWADRESFGRLPARQAARDRRNHSLPKIR